MLRVVRAVAVLGFLVAVLFLLAGRWDWFEGWAFVGIGVLGQGLSLLYVRWKIGKALPRSRNLGKGTKAWDKCILSIFGIAYVMVLVVSALDARHTWSAMGRGFWVLGVVLHAFFVFGVTWAKSVNPFFKTTVRIQDEMGHHVVDTGPYRVIRHPGYLASSVGFTLGTPLLLGSWWAFVPACTGVICLVVRVILEDRALRHELPGYEAYAQRVPYRFLPWIW